MKFILTGDFSNVIQRLENWDSKPSMQFIGDIHLNSEWLVEKKNTEFVISKSRPIIGYYDKSLSNFIAITKFEEDKAIIEIKLKPSLLWGLIPIIVVISFLILFSIYRQHYLGYVTILFPFWIYHTLNKEKKLFALGIKEFINTNNSSLKYNNYMCPSILSLSPSQIIGTTNLK